MGRVTAKGKLLSSDFVGGVLVSFHRIDSCTKNNSSCTFFIFMILCDIVDYVSGYSFLQGPDPTYALYMAGEGE